MKVFIPILILLSISQAFRANGQTTLADYLPSEVIYNQSIPTPKAFLGYEVGEWHVGHDQLVYYMKALAAASNRMTLETIGTTHEGRPLVTLTVTSPNNHKNLDKIRAEHLELSNPDKSKKGNIDKMPVVIYQGYSIHGNEPSGSNAALLYAYYLAAAEGDAIEKILDNTVILLDPCFNPDGLNRFASWVNTHKSQRLVTDPNDREFNETWPKGRTNHYWFDLNRDWLLVQQPESQARIRQFHAWKPNVLTDHHEMGTNSTFFFQPGVPSRTHPLTPLRNQALTGKIGEYHARFLDEIGSLYFTKESFDDFYYGKGSTYPDINGGVGILFEQASSRGHAQESVHGVLTFPFTIKNQFTTSLSTLQAAFELKNDLLLWQKDFYTSALSEAAADKTKAFVFGDKSDANRTAHFIELLLQHEIQVFKNKTTTALNGKTFEAEQSYLIPLNQPQYRLIKAIFEQRTTFTDSLFYDVSGFNLALAFNMPYSEILEKPSLGDAVATAPFPKGEVIGEASRYAYLFHWSDYHTPGALYALLNKKLVAKVANSPFSIQTKNGLEHFDRGTIMIPVARQPLKEAELFVLMQKITKENGISIYTIKTGASSEGVTLGSPSWETLRLPNALMVVDGGVSSYDAGEVWHLLDVRYKIPLTKMSSGDFKTANLDRYNTIILVNGNYPNDNMEGLKTWLRKGNTLILYRNAIAWAKRNGLADVNFVGSQKDNESPRAYADYDADRGARFIGGAIFETKADLTHPLLYGYQSEFIPVFKRGTLFLERSKNQYATPLVYTEKAIWDGYVSDKNLNSVRNSAAIIVNNMGNGKVICMADNSNFRAFWHGTNKLLMNAIFFGHTMKI